MSKVVRIGYLMQNFQQAIIQLTIMHHLTESLTILGAHAVLKFVHMVLLIMVLGTCARMFICGV